MKTLRFLALASVLAAAPAALAQRAPFEATVWGSYVHPSGTTSTDSLGTTISFGEASGAGFSFSLPMGQYAAAELSAFWTKPEGQISFKGTQIASMGRASMMPYMAIVQFHPMGRGDVDPYFGGGIAYTVFGSYTSADLDAMGIGRVALEDTLDGVAAAGVRFGFGKVFGVTLDARYIWLHADSKGPSSTQPLKLIIEPVFVSAGISLRF